MSILPNVGACERVARNVSHVLVVEIIGNQFPDRGPGDCLVVLRVFHFRTHQCNDPRCIVQAIDEQLANLDHAKWIDRPHHITFVDRIYVMDLDAYTARRVWTRELVYFHTFCLREHG